MMRFGSLIFGFVLLALPVAAQNPAAPQAAGSDLAEKQSERTAKQFELEATERNLKEGQAARDKLKAEVESLRADRGRLNQSLIDATAQLKATEARISAVQQRLTTLAQTEEAIRRSLDARRGIIVEVLASLQRMGRRPPPALLVKPEDMLEALRSSMMLGAVVPELRAETEALASDLAELVRLRDATALERDTLARDTDLLIAERQRLAALVEARQKALAQAEGLAADEQRKADALVERAKGLRDLLGRLEADLEAEAKAAAAGDPKAKEARERFAMLAGKDPARLAPKTPFQEMKGSLPLPISGSLIKGFNAPDGMGGTVKGVAYATRPGAVVSAPCDGWVAFAGPFRTFGQLLIINAGGGYYLLLAGMERVNVSLGQFVLAGEPVAVMGESSKATSASVGADTQQPVLYIEFRKDGNSFDPSPWWANSTGGKVRG